MQVGAAERGWKVAVAESIVNPDEVAETLRRLVRDSRKRHDVMTQERM
jgi:hypothetical protein